MKRNVIETVLGAVVLAVALFFLVFSYSSANVGDVDGYDIIADFSGIGGLKAGDTVQISGVKVGTVSGIALKPDDYMARVTIEVHDDVKIPDDTAALISSESLLGGKYLELQPGGSDTYLASGGQIQYTQAPQNLEQLLGKFIFSVQENKDGGKDDAPADAAAKPAPAGHGSMQVLPESP